MLFTLIFNKSLLLNKTAYSQQVLLCYNLFRFSLKMLYDDRFGQWYVTDDITFRSVRKFRGYYKISSEIGHCWVRNWRLQLAQSPCGLPVPIAALSISTASRTITPRMGLASPLNAQITVDSPSAHCAMFGNFNSTVKRTTWSWGSFTRGFRSITLRSVEATMPGSGRSNCCSGFCPTRS